MNFLIPIYFYGCFKVSEYVSTQIWLILYVSFDRIVLFKISSSGSTNNNNGDLYKTQINKY